MEFTRILIVLNPWFMLLRCVTEQTTHLFSYNNKSSKSKMRRYRKMLFDHIKLCNVSCLESDCRSFCSKDLKQLKQMSYDRKILCTEWNSKYLLSNLLFDSLCLKVLKLVWTWPQYLSFKNILTYVFQCIEYLNLISSAKHCTLGNRIRMKCDLNGISDIGSRIYLFSYSVLNQITYQYNSPCSLNLILLRRLLISQGTIGACIK